MEKVVVITGASSGLGKELAKTYFEKGYRLVLNGIDRGGLQEFIGKENVVIVLGDLTKEKTIDKMFDAVNSFGQVDILINNAGILYIEPFEKNTPKQLDQILAIDLKVPMILTQRMYPLMIAKRKGVIININSTSGKEPKLNHTMYTAAKFGLTGFTQSLRLEAKQYGIRVLSIHPGGIKTPLYDALENVPDTSTYMDAKNVAEIVVFLSETEGLSPDEIIINRLSK